MSNQILISSGAKLRDLDDVIIGTDGILSSLGFDVPYGVPRLDGNGKILASELPNSVMEFKGVWNAATNTPTLTNGVGNAGDVYLCNVAGTVDFGAGPITFAVGDYAVYTGSVWARSSGAVGTVTSVGVSRSGDALAITGSPITTSGTINIGFAGSSTQYINGAGNLVTFPTIAQEAQRLITEVYNETGATLTKGTIVYINGGHGNLPTVTKAIATGDATSAQTYGIVQNDIGNNNNGFVVVIGSLTDIDTQAYTEGTQLYLSGTTAGAWTSTKPYAPIHLVYVAIVTRSHPTQGVVEVSIQNGYEMDELHNVAAQNPDNNDILQYKTSTNLWTKVAGTTSNIAEGSNLYFTNARARQSISLTTTGSTGAATYDNTTGVLNIPNYVDQYVGTVTSVGLSAPTGFSVTGSPVTSSGTLALSFAAGYSLPTNIKQSNWDDAYTWVAAFPTQTGNAGKFLTTDGSTLSWAANPLGTVTSVAMSVPTGLSVSGSPITTSGTLAVTFAAGYSIPTDASQTNWNTAYTNRITSLTTTGSSGAATLVSNTLNIPNYTLAGLGGVPTTRTLTINGVAQDLSADRTWTITAGISSVSGTAPISVSTVGGAATVSISQATTTTNGYLSSTDWNTFNGKQNALTNPVTGTGNNNYIAKFTTTGSTIGNSLLQSNTSNVFINQEDTSLGIDGQALIRLGFVKKSGFNPTMAYSTDPFTISSTAGTSIDATNTFVTRFTMDLSGNIGLGITPSAWASPFTAIQIGTYGQHLAGQSNGPDIKIGSNNYYNGSNYIYTTSTGAVQLNVGGFSGFQFNVADVGVAGAAVTFTQAMSINRNGNVVIGAITDNGNRFQVTGNSTFLGNVLIGTSTALQSNEKVGIETDTNTALIAKFTGGAATGWASKFWNNATSGNNLIIEFLTESSITSRGSIRYDRSGDRLNILGAGSGLLFSGVSTFSSSVTATGLKSQFIANGISSGAGISFNTDLSGTERRNWFLGTEENIAGDFVIKSSTAAGGSGLSGNLRFAILNNGNIYIGTSTGVSGGGALQVNGNVNINGLFQINGVTIGGGGGSGVTGSGSTNYIPKWTGSTSLGNSVIQDTGTNVGIGAAPLSFTRLYVTDTGANITGGNAIAGTSIKGVMIENSNNEDQSIGLWFRTGNNHLSGISGQRFNSSVGWGTDLRFYTHENATVDLTYTRERMRITTEGNILIGTTSDNGYKINLNGSISFAYGFLNIFRGSSGAGDIFVGNDGSRIYIGGNTYVVGNVTATGGFFDTSDSRLKTLIEDNYLLSSIANVKAKLYIKDGRKELGYYAQDLNRILPSAVKEGSDGFLSLSYAQVHTAKIAVIEDEVTILKNRVSELETKLQKYDA